MGRGYNTMQKWLQCYAARTMSSPMAQKAPSQRCSLRHSTMLSKAQAQLPKLLDMTPKQRSNNTPKTHFWGALCWVFFWPQQEIRLLWVLTDHSQKARNGTLVGSGPLSDGHCPPLGFGWCGFWPSDALSYAQRAGLDACIDHKNLVDPV